MPDSDGCRDYIIKDGRYVGNFEEMYRSCPDPWNRDVHDFPGEDVTLSMLPRSPLNQVSDILDIGCGVGRFTERIFKATGAAVSAIDTAPTAIAIAKARYPEINFQVATVPPLTFPDEAFDVVTIRQLLWYVLPKMPELFSEARRVLRPGGCCLVIQSFFRPGEQHYGNAYMTTPEDLVNVMLPLHLESRVDIDPESDWNVVLLARKD